MEQSELLTEFRETVDEFIKTRSFIDKALAQAEKFDSNVIQKVVESHTEKSNGIVEKLIPLTADIEQQQVALEAEKAEIASGQDDARLELQELELRQVIGEMTKKQFESKSKSLKKTLDEVDSKVAELDEVYAELQKELDRWKEAAESAGVAAPQPVAEEAEVEVAEADDGVHLENVSVVDDMSVVFDGDDESGDELVADDDSADEILEAVDADDLEEIEELDDVIEAEEAEIDILVDDEDDSLELEDAAIEAEDVNGTGRRAVLLYLEGTADELVHPINSEVISLGRGRDNDIQVKNDSKVSRYHCKIYSRGPNYYIEDNKSANGSLVNGELITERRLFGGEEIIIGETFFRFRILD